MVQSRMGEAALINIEVAYAKPDQQIILPLRIAANETVADALLQSGIAVRFPEIDIDTVPVGIFGHAVKRSQVLRDGDRIEIYRPLLCDPKEVRRRRAKK